MATEGSTAGADHAEVRASEQPGRGAERGEQHPLGPPPTTLTMPASQRPGGTARVTAASVRENMLVLGADGDTVGAVAGPDAGETIRLRPDALGQSHWLPLAWIARVDDQAHLDRHAAQARQEWLTEPPAGA